MIFDTLPEEVIERFIYSRSICALTGAGISIESGIASFRGPGHAKYFQGLPPYYLASQDAWQRFPDRVNNFFNHYRALAHAARPGIAHQTLHAWEIRRFFPSPFFQFKLLTHNFDGLHQLIGSEQVIELHGSIWRMRCGVCQQIIELTPFRNMPLPKSCDLCDGRLRPDITLLDECIPEQIHRQALMAAEQSEIFISIGISGVTRYAALLAGAARRNRQFLIEINPQPTAISELFDVTILGRAEDILPLFPWDYLPNPQLL
jgi:NAD-dependent deacetylase